MLKNDINVFYTGCEIKNLCANQDLKLTLDLYMKIQSEYLFSRTTNISMVTTPCDKCPAKLSISVVLDNQLIGFINDWSNNTFYEELDQITISFLSLNLTEDNRINALGFTGMKPVFDEYVNIPNSKKGTWKDKLSEGEEYTFEFEGNVFSNSPHFDIIVNNFVNVINPEDLQAGIEDIDTVINPEDSVGEPDGDEGSPSNNESNIDDITDTENGSEDNK